MLRVLDRWMKMVRGEIQIPRNVQLFLYVGEYLEHMECAGQKVDDAIRTTNGWRLRRRFTLDLIGTLAKASSRR